MRAQDLELLDLISISDGDINLRGRRLVLHSIHAFSQFRYDILRMLGKEHARRLFTRFGFFWGQADAAALQRLFRWPTIEEWIQAGLKLHSLEGVVQTSVSKLAIDKKHKRFHMEISWHDSVEVEEHLMASGPSDQTVCWKLIGYFSGLTSYCMGQSIYFIESQCQGKQDSLCRAIGKNISSWNDEISSHLKYFEAEDIKGTVQRLTRELREKTSSLRKHKKKLKELHRQSVPYLVEGRSKSMQDVLTLAGRVAKFDSSVLITGETGTGKEVLAKYIHEVSHRASGPFVTINCAALPESLIDSELFGHKSGSFTGAVRDRVGLIEAASKGTVFIDEVGDISAATQLKILRVLQEKEILRIGENKPRKSDVRIIAATNRDLNEGVKRKEFREDLLYRLSVVEIRMPALRERHEDILPLSKFLIERITDKLGINSLHLDATCLEFFETYEWPGNVRELENTLERAAVVSTDGIILPEHLPTKLTNQMQLRDRTAIKSESTLKQVEMAHIIRVLDFTGGNRTKASKILGISETTLWRKLKKS